MNTSFITKEKYSFKQVLLASFLAVSLPTAAVAHAEHDGGDKGQSCERVGHEGKPAYLRGLDLTSTQKDQLFNLYYAQIPTVRDQHKQHQQLKEELRSTVQADKFDDVKAQLLADKAAKLEKEQVLARARHDAKVFALLTPEQRKKAREIKIEGLGFGRDNRHHNDEYDGNNRPAHFKKVQHSITPRAI